MLVILDNILNRISRNRKKEREHIYLQMKYIYYSNMNIHQDLYMNYGKELENMVAVQQVLLKTLKNF